MAVLQEGDYRCIVKRNGHTEIFDVDAMYVEARYDVNYASISSCAGCFVGFDAHETIRYGEYLVETQPEMMQLFGHTYMSKRYVDDRKSVLNLRSNHFTMSLWAEITVTRCGIVLLSSELSDMLF